MDESELLPEILLHRSCKICLVYLCRWCIRFNVAESRVEVSWGPDFGWSPTRHGHISFTCGQKELS